MLNWVTKLFGDTNAGELKKLAPIVAKMNALEDEMRGLSAAALRDKSAQWAERCQEAEDEDRDALLPEAFAAVREAARRTIGLRHYDVQLIGGLVLHRGKIAEMKTGEGKTLVATLPLYFNALAGQGAHLVTVNDYLAKRDAQWMGPIYDALGLTVGVIQHESAFIFDPEYQSPDPRVQHLRPVPRAEAYLADITYGTNNEFGFDYLRDNMVTDLSQRVQRGLHYAIVDEVDNILIDEARTPLIISSPAEEATQLYYRFAELVRKLRRGVDFAIEEKTKSITLTEDGISHVERLLNIDNIYDHENSQLTHFLDQALKAEYIFKRDRDYVLVIEGQVIADRQPDAEVVIVDEFTGRLMFGRRYSEGLHQAIEAKENVRIQRESLTWATITFQNLFRMYGKLSGMTGTAATEAEEFHKIYGLDVVVVPTHRPMIRNDQGDLVYKKESAKFKAVVDEIEECYNSGRPVLVGTVSIERSEHLSEMLKRRHVDHQVLNAKYHEREAGIIAQAGRPKAVTIATNMAGRGVDILLGGNPHGLVEEALRKDGVDVSTATPDQVAEARARVEEQHRIDRERVLALGGLHIVGTERHEARRIDNQLRGRAGRQGDPGSSRFYVSLEDELMRRFGGGNIASIMDRLGLEDDVPIEHGIVSKSIENAQTKVEGYNFDIRKHLVEYDDVVNKQREVIYAEREKVIGHEDISELIRQMVRAQLDEHLNAFVPPGEAEEWDLVGLLGVVRGMIPLPAELQSEELEKLSRDEVCEHFHTLADSLYEQKELALGIDNMRQLERIVLLQTIDRLWVAHLTALDDLRQGIGLRAYGQQDPLVAFKSEAFSMFEGLKATIQREVAQSIYMLTLVRQAPPPPPSNLRTNREEEVPNQPAHRPGKKVGRNDPCPCGSGRKYKKCHGR